MIGRIWKLIYLSFQIWGDARASRMAAAMTYYSMLSLAPLLTLAIAVAGYFFGDQLAQEEIVENVALFTTDEIAATIGGVIENASMPETGLVAGTISFLVLMFGASGVFSQLHDTFDEIWDVPLEERTGILITLQQRLIGVVMVLIAGVLLIFSIFLSTALSKIGGYAIAQLPQLHISDEQLYSWLQLIDRGVSFLIMPIVIAALFWLVPSAKVSWRDVLPAAMLTALLVSASRRIIEVYLGFSSTSEVYGAAGSLVVLLVWIYMLGMVIFFGAAFCRAWAEVFGTRSRDTLPDLAHETAGTETAGLSVAADSETHPVGPSNEMSAESDSTQDKVEPSDHPKATDAENAE